MTELLLIRHGQAVHNLEGRWEGWGAAQLTEDGERQAHAVARRLKSWSPPLVHLYTSPLLRARQTADPIARRLGTMPTALDGLREIDFGQVSGLTMNGFRETMPEVYSQWQDRSDLTFQFPGGEQRLGFFRRVGRVLEEIVARHPGEPVVVVTHGGTLRAGLAHLFPETMGDWWAYGLGNASLSHLRLGAGAPELLALNDCRHLAESPEKR